MDWRKELSMNLTGAEEIIKIHYFFYFFLVITLQNGPVELPDVYKRQPLSLPSTRLHLTFLPIYGLLCTRRNNRFLLWSPAPSLICYQLMQASFLRKLTWPFQNIYFSAPGRTLQ